MLVVLSIWNDNLLKKLQLTYKLRGILWCINDGQNKNIPAEWAAGIFQIDGSIAIY